MCDQHHSSRSDTISLLKNQPQPLTAVMDRHCSRQSPYQPSAGQVYLDHSRLERRDDGIDQRFRALDLSSRPLSASELEEHHEREARLRQQANTRWATIEQMHPAEKYAFTALHRCKCPPGKANNGKETTYRQLSGEVPQHSQPKPRPRPPYLENEDPGQRRSLGTRRSERGYLDFETADEKRRVVRMGLGGRQSHGVAAIPQSTIPIPTPGPTHHLPPQICAQEMLNQSKAHQQQSEPAACGQRVRESTDNVSLKARASKEAEQRKLAQQKREEQRVQLPAAKPGHLYPGPTRVSGTLPPNHILNDGDTKRSIASELALTVHLKSKMVSQEEYRKYKERKDRKEQEDEQRKVASSGPRFEPIRTRSFRQLIGGVNQTLEQKVKAPNVEAAKTENETSRAKLQQPHEGPEDTYKAGLSCGKLFWYKYDKNHPMARQSDDISYTPSHDSGSIQPLMASPDHPTGADESARRTGLPRTEFLRDLSQTKDLHAAVEAIDKVSGDLLESPKSASGQDEKPYLEPWTASISRNREKCVVNAAGLPPVTAEDASVKAPRQDVSLLPIPQAYLNDVCTRLREDHEEGAEDAAEAVESEEVDIELGWEEVGDGLEDEGWSDVEQDLVDDEERFSPSYSDVEWANVGSEGCAADY